jgi:hypothetical protein
MIVGGRYLIVRQAVLCSWQCRQLISSGPENAPIGTIMVQQIALGDQARSDFNTRGLRSLEGEHTNNQADHHNGKSQNATFQ